MEGVVFGNAHTHVHFSVYVQPPKMNIFRKVYECKQNECGKNGHPHIKYSDLENETPETLLFTIKKNSYVPSMVSQLPMIQKSECDACVSSGDAYVSSNE